jgi:hypothetical protein
MGKTHTASTSMSASTSLDDQAAPTGPLVDLCTRAGIDHVRLPRLATREGRLAYVEYEGYQVRLHSVSLDGGDYRVRRWSLVTGDFAEDYAITDDRIELDQNLDDDDHRTALARVILALDHG